MTIDFGSQSERQIQRSCVIAAGSTVLDALRVAVPIVTSRRFGMDYFVEEICGVGNNFETGHGWHFDVNGYRSNVAAERYLLKSGDWIKWLYLSNC
jgi:hypothetical protein